MVIEVLYVDDELGILQAVKLSLEDTGICTIDTAESAEQALTMLDSHSYEAIISDYDMPEMDGIELLRVVRERFGDIPFILYTGLPREDVLIEAINSGLTFYLQKGGDPEIQFAELIHMLEQAVTRRRAEQNLLESENRYRAIFEDAILGIYRTTREGTYLDMNPAFARMFGYTSSDEMRMTVSGIWKQVCVRPEDRISIKRSLEQDGEVRNFEAEGFRKDKSRIWIRINAKAIYDREGAFRYCEGTCEDITEQRSAESSRDIALALSRQMIVNAGDGITIYDKDLRYLEWNPQMEIMTGYTRDEVLGKICYEFFPILSELGIDTLIRRALTGEVIRNDDIQLVKQKTGEEFWVSATYTPYRDGTGNIIGVIGLIRDITDRKRTEAIISDKNKELAESEQRYRTIIENIIDVYYRTDRDSRLIYISPSCLPMLGYNSIGELIGRKNGSFWKNPKDRDNMLAILMEKGAVSDYEVTLLRRDGTSIEVAASSRIYTDERGAFAGVEGIFRDISERKKAEADLQTKNRDLALMNGELTATLEELTAVESELAARNQELTSQQESLNQSHQAIREANRQLNLLASITRHDILNKITVLNGYLTLIREESPNKLISGYLDVLESVAGTIETQIAFTRIYQDLGSQEPQWIPVSSLIAPINLPGIIRIESDIKGIEVYTDPISGKVFENLLDNTLRHGKKVSRVAISSYLTPQGLIITWEDDGIGIPYAEKELIFERGYGKNTGLGLFLVREILSITGITIREIGIPGEGVRFEILVPEGGFRINEGIQYESNE